MLSMGTFTYPITLLGAAEGVSEPLDALVDTGATFTTMPGSVLKRLGVQVQRKVRLRLADGRDVQWEMGEIRAQLDGESSTIWCVFASEDTPALIGAHTLEAFLLVVNPVDQRLIPKEALLM